MFILLMTIFTIFVFLFFCFLLQVAVELAEEYYYIQAANYLEVCYQKIGLTDGKLQILLGDS